jgi:hypothetical protein
MTSTERKIIEQLTENTGRSMLDSGDAYGRNYEKNRGRDFKSEPATTLVFGLTDVEVTHNVFHWLNERLDYDGAMQRKFKAFARRKEYAEDSWLFVMQEFAKHHGSEPMTVNTYNGEDLVSQILQYVTWYDREDYTEYVALQVHGGCDARGGYSVPVVYRVTDGLFDNAHARIFCKTCRAEWDSDEGYYWRPGDYVELPERDEPTLFDQGELEVPDPKVLYLPYNLRGKQKAYEIIEMPTEEFPVEGERQSGKFYITPEGKGLCPVCQSGMLKGLW